jgi:hypothetical protein
VRKVLASNMEIGSPFLRLAFDLVRDPRRVNRGGPR